MRRRYIVYGTFTKFRIMANVPTRLKFLQRWSISLSCDGKENGNYRFEHDSYYREQGDYFGFGGQCDAYYRCQEGVASAVK